MIRSEDSAVDLILVHGLFHGGWCWSRVSPLLAGFTVLMPGLSFASLADDASVVESLIAERKSVGRRVVVVGHSYAGMVISAGGHEADALVYLAAVVPHPGQTMRDAAVGSGTEQLRRVMSANGQTVSLGGSDDDMIAALFNLSPLADFRFARDRLRPVPRALFAEPVANPAWLTTPSTYIVCDEDHSVEPSYQVERSSLMSDSTTIHADHSAYYSTPHATAHIIASTALRMAVRRD